MHLAHIYWDPSPEIFSFNIPLIGRPLLWYGLLFAFGFFLSYRILISLAPKEMKPYLERLSTYIIVGSVIGARLGEILCYQNLSGYLSHPLEIFKVWHGGLSSHGGALGALIALLVFYRKSIPCSWKSLLDLLVTVAPLAGCFIRLGNFMNQEILGTPSTLPWAVICGHPLDGSAPIPRHPVQLYEALFYAALFIVLKKAHNTSLKNLPGFIGGCGLITLFTFRFFIELCKADMSFYTSSTTLFTMGQYLSIPFITLGVYLVVSSYKARALCKK